MTNANDARRAHDLLDGISIGHQPNEDDLNHLRSFLPELPKQKTLEEITLDVLDALAGVSGNDWGVNSYAQNVSIEDWLSELHAQLQGLTPANPAHPEFLETEADYAAAPEGTIVACDDSPPWHKFNSEWLSTITYGYQSVKIMSGVRRQILRWGWGE